MLFYLGYVLGLDLSPCLPLFSVQCPYLLQNWRYSSNAIDQCRHPAYEAKALGTSVLLERFLLTLNMFYWKAFTGQWALDIFTPQLHTLQTTKSWLGLGNEVRVRATGAVRAGSARAATCGVEQWVWSTHSTLSSSLLVYLQAPVRLATPTHAARQAWYGYVFLV